MYPRNIRKFKTRPETTLYLTFPRYGSAQDNLESRCLCRHVSSESLVLLTCSACQGGKQSGKRFSVIFPKTERNKMNVELLTIIQEGMVPQEGESGSSSESWPAPQHSLRGLPDDHWKDQGKKTRLNRHQHVPYNDIEGSFSQRRWIDVRSEWWNKDLQQVRFCSL